MKSRIYFGINEDGCLDHAHAEAFKHVSFDEDAGMWYLAYDDGSQGLGFTSLSYVEVIDGKNKVTTLSYGEVPEDHRESKS